MDQTSSKVMVRDDQLDTSNFRLLNSYFTPYQTINCSSLPCSQLKDGKMISCNPSGGIICDTAGRQCCYSLNIKEKGSI